MTADLTLANQLADAAAVISLSFFKREIGRWSKPDGSLATEADVAVERELRRRFAIERPGDAFLGEEEGQSGDGERRWIVDAIDGTIGFADGTAEWGTLIALEAHGTIVVAICDQPVKKRRFWAVRGQGAFCIESSSGVQHALRVTDHADLASARSYVPPPQWLPTGHARRIAKALATSTTPTAQTDHPALQVATGGYEVVVFMLGGPWDVAAPSLIVEEAGGMFTDAKGRHDIFGGTALFSNGTLHDAVLKIIP